MKKLIALFLAMIMVLSLAVTAFAAEGDETTTGTITINGVSEGNVYAIYKLLDLESYDVDAGAYSYKVNSEWTDFFKAGTGALDYVALDNAGYVTWIAAEDDTTVATFAKLALAYAEANGIDPVKSSANEGEFVITGTTGTFSDLELGYYLVDSTMGALCGLTTTNPDASINAKNGIPTVDKQVQEDSTEQWGDNNTADIGQTVNFRVTINVHAGAQNYVLHDLMSEGLDFQADSVSVTLNGSTVDAANYTVVTEPTCDSEEGCSFEIVFDNDFVDDLETNDKLIIFYSAILNRHAVIADPGNPNETWLGFGENHTTTHDTTNTKTYSIDIVKTDSQNRLIDGAQFKIYDAAEGGNELGVVPLLDKETGEPVLDDAGNPIYRRARKAEQDEGKCVPIVVTNGKVTVVGLDNGTYYLEETVAPAGYNKLTARQKFIISDGNLSAVFNGDVFSTGSGVHVVNKTGTMLPETGAAGTLLFICCGAFLVMATGVLLVTKKRMTMIQE